MQLIIHADDLGETVEISDGIFRCIDAGVITSTSIMANMLGTDFAIKQAKSRPKNISFGAHLNICEGYPLTSAHRITQHDGSFYSKKNIALKAIFKWIRLKDIEIELSKQIERISDSGIRLSHIDSHKHLHQLPGVSAIVAKLAKKFGIKRIRCTLEREFWPKGMDFKSRIFRAARIYFAKRAGRIFRAAGLRHPKQSFDLKQLMEIKDHKARLYFIRRLDGLVEMFCHPGTKKADVQKPGSYSRYNELQFLISDEFRALITESQLELKTFWDC